MTRKKEKQKMLIHLEINNFGEYAFVGQKITHLKLKFQNFINCDIIYYLLNSFIQNIL